MDPITLKCSACQQPLKFPATRAGTKAKCTRCGAELMVPTNNQPPPAAAPPPSNIDEDDDGPNTYGLTEVVQEKKKIPFDKKKKKEESAIQKRKKTLLDADEWRVVRGGLTVMFIGSILALIILSLQTLVLLLGCTQGTEFNTLRAEVLFNPNIEDQDLGSLRLCRFVVSISSGSNLLEFTMIMHILLALAALVQIGLFMIGYFTCSAVPERFGAKGQITWLIILGGINALIIVVFRLLPLLGGPGVVVPFLVPELPCVEANIERTIPLHIFWSRWWFFDMFLTMVFIVIRFAEVTLGGVFLRSVGLSIKEENLSESAKGLIHLAMGTCFLLICYYLVSLGGNSDVLISMLRLIYLLAVSFQFLLAVRYMMMISTTRTVLDHLLSGYKPREDDDEDDDEGPRKKKKKKRRIEEDEDDEEEEEPEDDDDDDDNRPRGKSKKRR